MKGIDSIIVMADIVNSRDYELYSLMESFRSVTDYVNKDHKQLFLSPITITLGDEFQCIATDLHAAVEIIFAIEERLLYENTGIKLRYVISEGQIDTAINAASGFGMMGRGLIVAREQLSSAKKKKGRFSFHIKDDAKNNALYSAFCVYEDYIDSWNPIRDYPIVTSLLKTQDYKSVAASMNKTQSQIWKRKKSLRFEQYIAIKQVIGYISN